MSREAQTNALLFFSFQEAMEQIKTEVPEEVSLQTVGTGKGFIVQKLLKPCNSASTHVHVQDNSLLICGCINLSVNFLLQVGAELHDLWKVIISHFQLAEFNTGAMAGLASLAGQTLYLTIRAWYTQIACISS